MAFAPPTPHLCWHTDNLADHLTHEITHWCKVDEVAKTLVEPTTERFLDEGEFTLYIVKTIEQTVTQQGLYCDTCKIDLDVPNQPEWAT